MRLFVLTEFWTYRSESMALTSEISWLGSSIKFLNSYRCWRECVMKTQAKLMLHRKPHCWSWFGAKSLTRTLEQSLEEGKFDFPASSFSNFWDPKLDAREMHVSISVQAWMNERCCTFGFRGQDQDPPRDAESLESLLPCLRDGLKVK